MKFAWWANASLNLPIKTPMNDNRAILAMQFNSIIEVDCQEDWSEKLTTQVEKNLHDLELAKL